MSKAASRARPRLVGRATPSRPARRSVSVQRLPRGIIVSIALVAALGLTTALLALLSPSPLSPDFTGQLSRSSDSLEPLFAIEPGIQPGRWTAVYVHHSNTPSGNASTLADAARERGILGTPDHFVIGNGDGMNDGEIQFTERWTRQLPAAPPALGVRIEPDCISICLIGDFDRNRPTVAQRARLDQVLAVLAERLNLRPDQLIRLEMLNSAAGTGSLMDD